MDDLLDRARAARSRALTPYSEYPVGAAVLTADGDVYLGANLEVANYSNSLHAEEVALSRALLDGHRAFEALAVSGPDDDGLAPCGMCRQTLAEYCDDDLRVVVDHGDRAGEHALGDLLPAQMSSEAVRDR